MATPPVTTIGPSLDGFKTIARNAVMNHYVAVAERDQRPATQRAMDVHKLTEARAVLSNGSSNLLSREAAMRGVPVNVLANAVLQQGAAAEQIELDRVEVSLAIDAATGVEQVVAALNAKGIGIGT